ncbi:hypothetical protein BGZ72_002289 [Mortierella alpina]|nr:hypothetical protein BGZ72_002289 [Mortierella alpina]
MSAVSEWIQTCDYFYPPLHHQNQEPQQTIYNVDSNAQNNILSAPYRPCHGLSPHTQQLQDTSNSSLLNLMSMSSGINPLPCHSEPYSQVLDVHLWSQLNAGGLNLLSTPLVPAVSQPDVSSLDSIGEQQQELMTVLNSWTQLFNPAATPSLASSSSNAPSPSLSPSLSSVYTPLSSLPSTPSHPFSSPSPLLSTNAASYPPPHTSEYMSAFKNLSHKFAPRTSSMLTRRQSQALALKSALALSNSSAPSETSSSSTWLMASSSPSSSSSPLTCQVCKKQYANSSTLRRHLKIHAYANSAARSLASSRSSTPFSDTASHTALELESQQTLQPQQHQEPYLTPLLCTGIPTLSLNDGVTSPLLSSMPFLSSSSSSTPLIQGYNPCSDPDIKKPECVGCNKAFARRDTVILHIKNQKRKWDLLSAMLPTLASTAAVATSTTAANGESSLDELDLESMHLIARTQRLSLGATNGSGSLRRKGGQKHRRTHPYRMVEKLWQSTMQRKGVQLACSVNNTSNGGGDHKAHNNKVKVEFGSEDCIENLPQGVQDEADETDDGWPSKDALSQMDSQAKLQWMMKMMVLPPCWKERKVRLFGAFGVLEEKVLQ